MNGGVSCRKRRSFAIAAAHVTERQQAHDAYARRMATLNEKALSVISMMLDKGDFRAAKLVVSFVESQRDPDRESADAKDLFLFDSLASIRK